MEKIVFSRKYRPKKISDVIGQDFAVKTIENAFESDNIGISCAIFLNPWLIGQFLQILYLNFLLLLLNLRAYGP